MQAASVEGRRQCQQRGTRGCSAGGSKVKGGCEVAARRMSVDCVLLLHARRGS
jgi:hypothetical protein